MRRNNNAYNQQVTLFVGTAKIIILNNTRQIDYAIRTIRLTEKILYTYHPPANSSKLKSKYISIPLEQLIKYEYQYMIKTNMRPKLLLQKYDQDIKIYLKELKAPELKQNQNCNIVAIAVDDRDDKERNYINGFIFGEEEQALNFYQALNYAIASQLYFELAQTSSLPFNYKLSNFLGNTLNGRCIIDPQDYSEQKVQEEIKFISQILSMMAKQKITNFKDGIFKLKLNFKIINQESRNYACSFISVMESKIQNLVLSQCQLNYKEFANIMEMSPFRIGDKMNELLHLDLSQNQFNDDFFQIAKNLLNTCKKLHNFNLSHNNFTFQKQSIIISFLTSINTYKFVLNLSNNKIKNTQFILKYFINAEGINPVEFLNISNNTFEPQDITSITNSYLQKTKKNENILILILNQIQFQDARSFQFLTRQHRITAPTVLNVPLSLSKHPFRKKGKQLGNTQEDVNKLTEIDQLIKNYGTQIFYGNFYKMKQIKDKLLSLKVDQQAIQLDSKHLKKHRKNQEQMIIRKMQSILNFHVKCKDVINELNQTIIFVRRKGLVGRGVGCLAYIKYKVEQKLARWRKQSNLGRAYRQCLFNNDSKYTNLYLNGSEMMQLKAKYPIVVKFNQKELTKALFDEQGNNNTTNCIAYSYLLLQECPVKYQRVILEHLLIDPLLSTTRIIRNSNIKKIIFQQSQRIAKITNTQKMSSIDITSKYGLQSYRFDQNFIQSGQSSSQYKGMLSCGIFEVQQEPTINQFIETFYNLMVFLYLTPQEISQQTIFYIKQITQQLMMKQNQKQNDLKCILIQQFIIRMITFFDSSKHRPLKHGLLLSICEFILRRIEIEEQLRLRLMAHFIKYDNFKQEQIHFHVSQSKISWQGKIDWLIHQAATVKQLIIKRGKLQISIADISNQNFKVPIQIDELDTVTDLWQLVRQNIQKIAEYTNINKNELDFYWLAGKKTDKDSWDLELLPSYQHICKLIFQDRFSKTFFLKRTVFPPQYHSTAFLKQLKYQDLLCLFQQARQNYRQSAHIMLGDILQTNKVKLTADIMWIEILIEEQIVLVSLRRQQSEQSLKKYQKQRQQINTKSLDKLHAKYMPLGSTFNQQNRNSLIAELQNRIKQPPPKAINQTIRENIVNLISNLGVCAFTTTITDSNKTSIFYCNNKLFCFEDKSQISSKKIYVYYKHLLWFNVVSEATPYMKFDIIDNMSQIQVERYSFTIHGSSCWLGQIYSLIVNICNLRLNFPGNLLCCLQDNHYGVSDSILVSQTNGLLNAPALQLSNLFEFKLPRLRRKQVSEHGSKIYEQLPPSLEEQQVFAQVQRNESKKQVSQILQKQLPVPVKKQQKPAYSVNSNQNFKQRQPTSQSLKAIDQSKRLTEVKEISLPPLIKKQQKSVQVNKANQKIPNTQIQPKIAVSQKQQLPNNMIDKSKYNPISSVPEQSVESSSRRAQQQNLQIEQIIQSANNPKQKQDYQGVTGRRSSTRSANNSRRKSRNR